VFVALVAAFGLWVAYSAFILSLYGTLGIWDAAQVFLLAIFLYLLNSLAFLESGHPLLYAGALFMIAGNSVLITNLRRARRYDENREILGRTSYRRTLLFGLSPGGVTLAFAIVQHARGTGGVVEGAFHLGFAIGLLIWLSLFMRAWRRSVSARNNAAA
jgi:hypothetical protein